MKLITEKTGMMAMDEAIWWWRPRNLSSISL